MRKMLGTMVLCLVIALPVSASMQAQETIISAGDTATISLNTYEIAVALVSSEVDLAGVEINAVEMGDFIGVNSVDPEGRYLPNVHIMPVDENSTTYDVELLQSLVGQGWRYRHIGIVDVAPFIADSLGTTTPAELHVLLSESVAPDADVNLIMPLLLEDIAPVSLAVYATPLPSTFIVVPADTVSDGVPDSLAVDDMIVMHASSLALSPYVLLTEARAVALPDMVGLNIEGGDVDTALALAQPDVQIGFRYVITPVACDDDDSGTVIAQKPDATTIVDARSQIVELEVCRGAATGTVNATGGLLNVRRIPGFASGNIEFAISNGTSLTLTGRSVDNVWLQIALEDGRSGWVAADFVDTVIAVETLPLVDVPVLNFVSDREIITSGTCVTISWRVENAAAARLGDAPVGAAGTTERCPVATTTYTLRATGNDGTVYAVGITILVEAG